MKLDGDSARGRLWCASSGVQLCAIVSHAAADNTGSSKSIILLGPSLVQVNQNTSALVVDRGVMYDA